MEALKIENIAIGDWVEVEDYGPSRITAISGDGLVCFITQDGRLGSRDINYIYGLKLVVNAHDLQRELRKLGCEKFSITAYLK